MAESSDKPCSRCNGTGKDLWSAMCILCLGDGIVDPLSSNPPKPCARCGGTGKVSVLCMKCHGTGKETNNPQPEFRPPR